MDDKLREAFSEAAHDMWCQWVDGVLASSIENVDGTLILSRDRIKRWKRLRRTPYSKLTEDEKDKDRSMMKLHSVAKFINLASAQLSKIDT